MMDDAALARAVAALLGRGDVLGAHDELARASPLEDPRLRYLQVLTVARLGDTARARWLYEAYGLGGSPDVDVMALRARLLKDHAFRRGEDLPPDADALAEACDLYAALARSGGGAYSAINAATLARIGGRRALSVALAEQALGALPPAAERGYFEHATEAEARLLLDQPEPARNALREALAAPDAGVGARSSTIAQFRRLAPALDGGVADALIEIIQPPRIATYCGHIFVPDAEVEAALAREVAATLAREGIGSAFGSLAAGSDILIAEQVLACGADLHVVLPVAEPDFRANSVASAGDAWTARYEACRARATSVTHASTMSYVRDPAQYTYAAQVTMGMARLRSRYDGAEAVQIAICEAGATGSLTRAHIEAWQASGARSIVVEADRLERPSRRKAPSSPAAPRGVFGLLFADFPGFSTLDERHLPAFWAEVMARAATVLNRYGEAVEYRNTWGDALYIVFRDMVVAADAALDLRASFAEVDTSALGLPPGAAMRIGLHSGAVYLGTDPVTDRMNYYGSEVARAARIEPITPAGQVYVSEPFAALLQLREPRRFACRYVGRLALAKSYGEHPLYRLDRGDR